MIRERPCVTGGELVAFRGGERNDLSFPCHDTLPRFGREPVGRSRRRRTGPRSPLRCPTQAARSARTQRLRKRGLNCLWLPRGRTARYIMDRRYPYICSEKKNYLGLLWYVLIGLHSGGLRLSLAYSVARHQDKRRACLASQPHSASNGAYSSN